MYRYESLYHGMPVRFNGEDCTIGAFYADDTARLDSASGYQFVGRADLLRAVNGDDTTQLQEGTAMAKWIVGVNIVGYMPDSEPVVFDTKREAIAYASETAREIRDDKNEYDGEGRTFRKYGNNGDYYIDCDDPYHLATHVWIDRISDEEASEYAEW